MEKTTDKWDNYPQQEALCGDESEVVEGTEAKNDPSDAESLTDSAMSEAEECRFSKAEALFRDAIEITKKTKGMKTGSYARYLTNLAWVLMGQRRYPEAEKAYDEAVDALFSIQEKHPSDVENLINLAFLGDRLNLDVDYLYHEAYEIATWTHPCSADQLSEWADLISNKGYDVEAERFYEEALRISVEAKGRNHPSSMRHRIKFIEAERDFVGHPENPIDGDDYARELCIDEAENVMANPKDYPSHSERLKQLNRLARLAVRLELHDEAEILRMEASEMMTKSVKGKDNSSHPERTNQRGDLAKVDTNPKLVDKQDVFRRELLDILEQTENSHSYCNIDKIKKLPRLLKRLRRHEAVEVQFKKALEVVLATPKDHAIYSQLLKLLRELAELAVDLELYDDAERIYREQLKTIEETKGKEHPAYFRRLTHFSDFMRDVGRYDDAEKLFKELLDIEGKEKGKECQSYAIHLSNLAKIQENLGKYDDAEKLYKEVLEIAEKTIGSHRLSVSRINELICVDSFGYSGTESEKLYKEVLEIAEKAICKQNALFAENLGSLVCVIAGQGERYEAEELMGKWIEIVEKSKGQDHPVCAKYFRELAGNLAEHGNSILAEDLYWKGLQIAEKTIAKDQHPYLEYVKELAGFLEKKGQLYAAESLHIEARWKLENAK